MSERERRYQQIFEHTPVALFEEDYTRVFTAIRKLRERGITDIGQYLTQHPEEVLALAKMIVVVSANLQAVQLFDADSKEELLVSADRLFAPDNVSIFKQHLIEIAGGARSLVNEVDARTYKGARKSLLVHIKIIDTGEDLVTGLVSCIDISQRKVIEAQVEAAHQELVRSNNELEQFAYIASHDLQEPLRMVASFAQLLERRYESLLDDKGRRYIGFIVDGARRMQTLISELLALSRVSTRGSAPEPTSCGAVLKEVLARIETAITESGAVITHDELPVVLADATQVAQVFQNLLTNAIKFRTSEAPRVHIGSHREGNAWTLSVRDNGIGIDPRHREAIFGIFRRLHARNEYPGTGMGLAIAKKIVQRHGGQIWVESAEGQGATFFFTLPSLPEGARHHLRSAAGT